MDARNPNIQGRDEDDEISLGDLVKGIWRGRAWAVAGGLTALILAGGVIVTDYLATPKISNFRQDIALMLGTDGTYPNGTAFSTNDLRSPIVLERVHAEAGLDGLGISVRDLTSALSVTPTASSYDWLIERYRTRLADTTLTYAERQQIEAEFGSALESTLSTGAAVELVFPPNTAIPEELGRAVVRAIPNTWADIYINRFGVLDLPMPSSSNVLVNADFIAQLDYPLAYDALVSGLETVKKRIATAMDIGGAQNLRAPDSGRTLFDIERDLVLVERYSLEHVLAPLTELGLNKSPQITVAAYRYQIDELSRNIQLARQNAQVIDSVLGSSANRDDAMMQGTGEGAEAPMPSLPSTVVQQFGPELVERLVAMSIENASVSFREALLQTKLEHERNALRLAAESDRIEQRLALISGRQIIENEGILAETFALETDGIIDQLNAAWGDVNAILAQANIERISHDKALFSFLPTSERVIQGDGILSRRTFLLLFASAIGGILLGLMAHFVALSVRRADPLAA